MQRSFTDIHGRCPCCSVPFRCYDIFVYGFLHRIFTDIHGCCSVPFRLRCWVVRLYAPQGQQLIAQGTALGKIMSRCAPCKGKSSYKDMRITCFCPYRTQLPPRHPTQGDTLGYKLLGFQPVNLLFCIGWFFLFKWSFVVNLIFCFNNEFNKKHESACLRIWSCLVDSCHLCHS